MHVAEIIFLVLLVAALENHHDAAQIADVVVAADAVERDLAPERLKIVPKLFPFGVDSIVLDEIAGLHDRNDVLRFLLPERIVDD